MKPSITIEWLERSFVTIPLSAPLKHVKIDLQFPGSRDTVPDIRSLCNTFGSIALRLGSSPVLQRVDVTMNSVTGGDFDLQKLLGNVWEEMEVHLGSKLV